MNNFNYFFTPVGLEYKKKLARNVGIGVVILFALSAANPDTEELYEWMNYIIYGYQTGHNSHELYPYMISRHTAS